LKITISTFSSFINLTQNFNMSSLPRRFTITVDGKHIAKPEQKNEEMFQAESGNEPAVFEIKDDRLVCGEWTLGRWVVENKSYLAKPVMWRKNEEASQELQPVEVKVGATGPEITFGGELSFILLV